MMRTNGRMSEACIVRTAPLLRKIDAVTIPVPDLDVGLDFYRDRLGHELRWRNDAVGQAGLGLPGSDSEIVLSTRQKYEPNWLVSSADEAAEVIVAAGGRVVAGPEETAVGRLVAAEDPFGNVLVLLDLSKGQYVTDDTGRVTGVAPQQAPGAGPG
jgi:predicted enzyme related to lactoylglutathione lyase